MGINFYLTSKQQYHSDDKKACNNTNHSTFWTIIKSSPKLRTSNSYIIKTLLIKTTHRKAIDKTLKIIPSKMQANR